MARGDKSGRFKKGVRLKGGDDDTSRLLPSPSPPNWTEAGSTMQAACVLSVDGEGFRTETF